jgi:hypothetical protein
MAWATLRATLRRLGCAVLLAGAGATAPACASPTLPLPPPELPTVVPATDGDHVRLVAQCGGAQPDAVIVIVNTNPQVQNDQAVSGSRADGCGAWDATVYAHSNDVLEITQEFGTTRSPPVVVQIR